MRSYDLTMELTRRRERERKKDTTTLKDGSCYRINKLMVLPCIPLKGIHEPTLDPHYIISTGRKVTKRHTFTEGCG